MKGRRKKAKEKETRVGFSSQIIGKLEFGNGLAEIRSGDIYISVQGLY